MVGQWACKRAGTIRRAFSLLNSWRRERVWRLPELRKEAQAVERALG